MVPRKMRETLKELQELTGEDQSTLIRRLVNKGTTEMKMDIAIDNYARGKTSLEQSSKIAGTSFWSFLDELRKRNVSLKYSMADAENEIQKIIRTTRRRKSI